MYGSGSSANPGSHGPTATQIGDPTEKERERSGGVLGQMT